MSVNERGFSLPELLIAMAISSVILLGAARFLPTLQKAILRQTLERVLEEEVWQRMFTLAAWLQRAGFCRGQCSGEGLHLESNCMLVRWDSNLNGVWEDSPAANADTTGFRLKNNALETLRGATSCKGKGWEKMTDPDFITVKSVSVKRQNSPGYAPELAISLTAHLQQYPDISVTADYSVTGHNL